VGLAITGRLNPVTVGIDVGQVNDPTAVCVCEVSQIDTGKIRYRGKPTLGHHDVKGNWIPPKGAEPVLRSEYTVRHIARLPLGTSYPDVAIIIADMLCSPMFANRNVRVLIDVTGVGKPVYEMLKKEIALRPQCKHIRLKPITFSHGEKYNRKTGVMAKKFLVSGLQSLLQEKRVHGPDTPEMKVTVEELRVYEIKVGDEGSSTYGAKKGKHDDLATALGLSCLEDPFSEQVRHSERIY
jgi:hypothetical protein